MAALRAGRLPQPPGARCLAFAPDSSTLAVGQKDGRITLWNVATRLKQSLLPGHAEFVASLVFAPDGRSLVSSGGDRIVLQLWDLTTGQARFLVPGQESMLVSLAFSPDSRVLVLGDQHSPVVRLRDAITGCERAVPAMDRKVMSLRWRSAPTVITLAAADLHGLIYSWDLPTLQLFPSRLVHAGIQTLAFAPNGCTPGFRVASMVRSTCGTGRRGPRPAIEI